MSAKLAFRTREILDANGLKAVETLEPEAFAAAPIGAELRGPVRVDLEFSVGGSRILLSGRGRGSWRLACARCLAPFEAPYDTRFEETFPSDRERVEALDEVRQGISLGIPEKPLCGPDCRGLCARCGKNLNAGACGCQPEAKGAFAEELLKWKLRKGG